MLTILEINNKPRIILYIIKFFNIIYIFYTIKKKKKKKIRNMKIFL